MASTYEIIRALPAKGFDWTGFVAALRAEYIALCAANNRSGLGLAEWDAAKGMRAIRGAAMEMACSIVHMASTSSKRIEASPETLAWGGFLGGETVVLTNAEAAEAATEWVANLAAKAA